MPLGRKKGNPGPSSRSMKQAQLTTQLTVVPLLGLLNALQVGIQLILLGEGNAVDALEGLPIGVAPPVGGVTGGELDGVALDAAGGVQVGANTRSSV